MDDSLVLEEALSIPTIIDQFSNIDDNPYDRIAQLISQKKIKYVVTIARGTSDCAALYSSYIFAKHLGLPTYSMPPSIITLEQSKFDFSEALVIVISQSGKSTDLVECEKKSRLMGARTVIITNNVDSPIVKEADYFLNMFAREEKSVAATKTFTQTLLVLIKLVFICLGKKNINDDIKKLSEIIVNDSINEWNTDIIDKSINTGFIIGRGVGFALSNEISLKFKELCQEMIEPFSSAEVMHGPKSLIENSFKLFLLGMNDKSGLTVNKDVHELKNYTNLIYEMSSNKNVKSDFFYPSNKILELDSVILMSKFYPWIIRYTISKGLNPDEPRYLTKVTQTF
ncbi:MAG: SIS domain-containing protein [Proteobacteria bacterium]|nr:SIS domain-containing protein [Pseudomonadota bacterium]MDA1181676.1 SIS domain-containing protein [Pseudomonadota bacterium]